MDKIRIVTRCTDGCKHCEWMFGSPRCLHSDMKTRNTEDDPCDPCLYQKVPTDSRMFHPECPLDAESITTEITQCLECCAPMVDDEPCIGKNVICPMCGNVHTIELSWTINNTGDHA